MLDVALLETKYQMNRRGFRVQMHRFFTRKRPRQMQEKFPKQSSVLQRFTQRIQLESPPNESNLASHDGCYHTLGKYWKGSMFIKCGYSLDNWPSNNLPHAAMCMQSMCGHSSSCLDWLLYLCPCKLRAWFVPTKQLWHSSSFSSCFDQ